MVLSGLLVSGSSVSTADDLPLKANPTLIGTKYCPGDAEIYSAVFKIRVQYVNHADKNLILDRGIGKTWYQERVARTSQDLADGKYEYNPNIDWWSSQEEKVPSFDSPGVDFVVLEPGKKFESEINAGVFVSYKNSKIPAGSIASGIHYLQIELSPWTHAGDPREKEEGCNC